MLDGTLEVWEMPSNHVRKSGHYNTSLSFPSSDLAVLADGAGTLHVVSTGTRVEITPWEVSLAFMYLLGMCSHKN
jgi:hypothetical protein